jgi:glucose-1-phosphate thymidylyltransferase
MFYGSGAGTSLSNLVPKHTGALLFAKEVQDPRNFGVIEISEDEESVLSLEEKPVRPRSNLVATGLYFYDKTLSQRTEKVKPSARGELEITDLNREYLADNELRVHRLPSSTVWLDTGTVDGIAEAAEFVRVVQSRQGRTIGSPREASKFLGLS